jgi:hypothetical protein
LFPFYQNFALDPNNPEIFYLPTVTSIWRKDNLRSSAIDSSLRNNGWNHLSNVDVGDAAQISYITASKIPANRLYYGTSLGKVYRLDNAHSGNPVPVDITGTNFPPNAFVACIETKESNADHLMVVFSNYNIPSLFKSLDGGSTWEPQGGNLEQFADGSGDGPSVRFVKSLEYNNQKVWFAGTSVGLFSTRALEGDATVWAREGTQTIGSVIVDMIDARTSDGFIAVATHGNGVYSTYFNPFLDVEENQCISSLRIDDPFPNPVNDRLNVSITSDITQKMEIRLMELSGRKIETVWTGVITPGENQTAFDISQVKPGVYLLEFHTPAGTETRKILKK